MTRRPQPTPPTTTAAPLSRRWGSGVAWLLAAIVLVAAGPRLYRVATAGLGLDEFQAIELCNGRDLVHARLPLNVVMPAPPAPTSAAHAGPWWSPWVTLDDVMRPPFFFLLLRGWRDVMGATDASYKLLPCVFSILSVVMIFRLVQKLHGPVPALWAALLIAVSVGHLHLAEELRGEIVALVLMLGAADTLVTIEKCGTSRRRRIMLVIWLVAAVMTDYFSVGPLAGLAVYACVRLGRHALLRVIGAFAAASGIFFVTWGPTFLTQYENLVLPTPWLNPLSPAQAPHVHETLLRLLRVPLNLIDPGGESILLAGLVAILFLAPLLRMRNQRGLLLWYLWWFGSMGIYLALDLGRATSHLGSFHAAMLASVGVIGVFAAGYARWSGLCRYGVPCAAVLACIYVTTDAFRCSRFDPQDWQPVAAGLSESSSLQDVIVIAADPDRARLIFLAITHYLDEPRCPLVLLADPATPALSAQLRAARHTWLVFDESLPPADRLVEGEIQTDRTFGIVSVGHVQWEFPAAPTLAQPESEK